MTGHAWRAPIALFVYNRPEHTRRTLESLAANPEAVDSVLHVYADGAKPGEPTAAVAAVRALLRERAWCGIMHVYEAAENRGLAKQILDGVTERLRDSESVIVLEDDLELAPGFLAYMNEALALYREESRVLQIVGFLPDLPLVLPETLFLRTASSWGWATWSRAWAQLRTDAGALACEITAGGRVHEFNLDGGYDFLWQLQRVASGRLHTWAILWYASIFLADGYVLHPGRTLVRNIGHDGSGTHSRPDERFAVSDLASRVHVERIPLVGHEEARRAMSERYRALSPRRNWWSRLRGWR
jgi:hypothetical protein